MKKIVLNIVVVSLQLLIVGLFFMTVFSEKVNITKKVSIVDNANLVLNAEKFKAETLGRSTVQTSKLLEG